MKDFFGQIYNGLLRFRSVRIFLNIKSNRSGIFPEVGFLNDELKQRLENILNIKIHRSELYEQALIHRSYLQVLNNEDFYSNERLEFLGDSILGMIVAEYLFNLHSRVPEGELTKMRSWLVNKNSLAICAKKLKLHKFIMMSYSAEKALESGSESILADTMEAVIAAIYIDNGFSVTKDFILHSLLPIVMDKNIMVDRNYKSILLEEIQSQGKSSPSYEVLSESGPDHKKDFLVGVFIGNVLIGQGIGKSKKLAEQDAAYNAIKNLGLNNISD